MTSALLLASHHAFRDLFFAYHIWNVFAYVPGNNMTVNPKWKIKTGRYDCDAGKMRFGQLKYRDQSGRYFPMIFNFGWQEREHVPGIRVPVLQLNYEYAFEREVLERMCTLSDEGCDIIANDCVVLEARKGYQMLIDIDLKTPDYEISDALF